MRIMRSKSWPNTSAGIREANRKPTSWFQSIGPNLAPRYKNQGISELLGFADEFLFTIISTMNAIVVNGGDVTAPPAFVTVIAMLEDGRRILAVWTGRFWWGEGHELSVRCWRPCTNPDFTTEERRMGSSLHSSPDTTAQPEADFLRCTTPKYERLVGIHEAA
jgi:hypothetical protein